MKIRTPQIVLAFLTLLLASCSKHPRASSSLPPSVTVTDLGIVEVANGSTNRIEKGGKVYIVHSIILKDQKATVNQKETILKGQRILLTINVEQTDSRGTVSLSPDQNILALPDTTYGIADGATGVQLTPHIKQ